MKFVIFTPALKISAIGRVAHLITQVLIAQGHKITIVRAENSKYIDDPTHNFKTEMLYWTQQDNVINAAINADALIYQVGDNYDFHQGCIEWLRVLPGIICLHDFFLGHLFYSYAKDHREKSRLELSVWYESKIVNNFFNYSNSEDFIENTREKAPMLEWICSMAQGVITHSSWGVDRILKSCFGPVYSVPLAYDAPGILMAPSVFPNKLNNDIFNILTVGHINSNKRVTKVIQAIGKSGILRERTVYRLVGKITKNMENKLSKLAKKYRVNLIISGEIDEATLAKNFQMADVSCCLRWPSLEAASASTIESMLYGKPTLVTDTGFYSELPDSCVKKIDPQNEIPSLQSALELLYKNKTYRNELGIRAKEYAKNTFTAERYVENLLNMVLNIRKSKPLADTTNYFIELMYNWGASEEIITLKETSAPLSLFNDRSSISERN